MHERSLCMLLFVVPSVFGVHLLPRRSLEMRGRGDWLEGRVMAAVEAAGVGADSSDQDREASVNSSLPSAGLKHQL